MNGEGKWERGQGKKREEVEEEVEEEEEKVRLQEVNRERERKRKKVGILASGWVGKGGPVVLEHLVSVVLNGSG